VIKSQELATDLLRDFSLEASRLDALIAKYEEIERTSRSLDLERLLKQLRLLSKLGGQSPAELIEPQWIMSLTSPSYKAGWSVAFNEDFELTVELLRTVNQLQGYLKKIVISPEVLASSK